MKAKHPILSVQYVSKHSRAYLAVSITGIGIALVLVIAAACMGVPDGAAPGFFTILILGQMAAFRRQQILENAAIMERLNAIGGYPEAKGPQNATPGRIGRLADGTPKSSVCG